MPTTTSENEQLSKLYDHLHDEFHIRDIVIQRKNFNLPVQALEFISKGETECNLSIRTSGIESGENYVIFKTVIVIFHNERVPNLAEFKIVYTFETSKDSKHLVENGNSYTILPFANEFLDHIIIATTRGIMYSELRGTYLDKTILPLTKPNKIMRK